MTSKVTAVGKTVDEAIEQGLAQLGVTRDRVEVNVLEHPSRGFLGLFGGRKARVELSLVRSARPEGDSAAAKTPPRPAALPPVPGELEFEDDSPRRERPNDAVPAPSSPSSIGEEEYSPRRERPNDAVPAPSGFSGEEETDEPGVRPEERYREAADFIRDVASAMGLDVQIDVRKNRDGGMLDISGPELGMLIGRRGQTLDALQLLASVVANRSSDKFVRLTLDAENFRRRRAKTLEELADRLAERVVRTRKEVVLEPMPPQERKVIHARLQNHPRVETGSRGEEPNRRVTITLK
ncbi:RNA-binding cell elongation regulator Jag/EloR [Saccharibacillus sp. CPCC 101409]|uniref:RNA-binding cell elongation regulator Jag/EloR n=1 Tax=Saccharibacillus sp. CPCC 101409 TaxID=3058041 RepID=UPI00267120B0|nr:RNA-binding cell elongation regulator Jag/EloR [Saccharibacillus sp. CPCC 101409]MDO3413224.1 RNA-binding cell elongation regulator Jag/EloR [Saccharibacillus sp. CPCC 101409]